jgi:3-hydroxyisobutyrate dehydrogenase-like beta-hydroxyacid dehydrogenase
VKVGLIGLGLMGTALSANLARAGHDVIGFDTEQARIDELVERGGTAAPSPADAAARSDVLVLSLPNSEIGREVCLGPNGILPGRPSLVVDTTTARPADSIAIGQGLAEAGVGFLDVTFSGNAAQAAERDIVAMVGGSAEDLREARPVLDAVARSVHHLGPIGAGARTKLVVNLVLGIHRMALAEGLVMGELAGIDLATLLEVLKDGVAYSKAMDVWGPRMVEGDHEPPASRIRQNHKDFRLILEQGQQLGSPTWLASTVRQLLQTAEATGLADADNSAVIEILRRQAGIGRIASER